MIRVDRGEEPEVLTLERERQIARSMLPGGPERRDDITGYAPDEVRKQLCARQHEKCAYCEKGVELEGYPVEHFRPKLGAEDVLWEQLQSDEPPEKLEDVPWARDPDRYRWLAWTWENLYYSCPTCNLQTYKANRFPLRRGSPRLSERDLPHEVDLTQREQPLLLDPAELDPLDHLRFTPDYDEDNWRAVGITPEGRWTVLVFGLNRQSLRTKRKHHVRLVIEKNVDLRQALDALAREDTDALRRHWMRAVEELLAPTTDFLALTWCVLDYRVPEEQRARYGLDLPRPGSRSARVSRPLLRPRPELTGLPEPLQMRVRALGGHPARAEMDELLVAICRARPCTADDLGIMLRRDGPYLRRTYLDALCAGSPPRLRRDPETGRYAADVPA